jgi:hypothetical protein
MATDACTTAACEVHESHQPADAATKQRAAIVVLSDPGSGSQQEALGRVFNALAAAYDFKQRGDDVSVLFQGAGRFWDFAVERWIQIARTAIVITDPQNDFLSPVEASSK